MPSCKPAFLLSVAAGDVGIARALVERGSDMDAVGHCGATALHLAAEYDRVDMIRWLVGEGVGVDAVHSFGRTALEAAVSVFEGIDLQALRDKSVALTELFIRLLDQELSGLGFDLLSPREAPQRGSQVSLRHERADSIMQALISRGVIGDVRRPDILRFGFAPLYVQFMDVWKAIAALRAVMHDQSFLDPAHQHHRTVI